MFGRGSVSPVKASSVAAASRRPLERSAAGDESAAAAAEAAALASLHKRMAGPSSGKAGLAADHGTINRAIYEASKGSRFFRREEEVNARIEGEVRQMLERKDELLKRVPEGGTEWRNIEKRIDVMAAELEKTRDLSRAIVHADMDVFYGACEVLKDPTLEGTCFGVGKGVLVTASYPARAFGVRSGMASHIALKLCPHIRLVDSDHALYAAKSREIQSVLRQYDENLRPASLDESYLDLTDYCANNEMSVDDAVAQLRKQVKETTGLTVSCGVAPNLMLAKICSDRNKPDGQYRILPERAAVLEFMSTLPPRKVPGIGRVTERWLDALGIETCGDIWKHRVVLSLTMRHYEEFLQVYLGLGGNKVAPSARGWRKSVGREHTFTPTSDYNQLLLYLRESAEKVAQDLKEEGYQGQKVTLTCKTSGYVRFTRDRKLQRHVWLADDLFRHAKELFDIERQRQGTFTLRLIGVRAGTLRDLKSADAPGNLKAAFEHANALQKSGPRHEKGEERLGDLGAFVFGNDDVAQSSQDAERELQEAIRASLEEAGLSEPAPDELPSRRPTPSRTPSDASEPAATAPAATALQEAGALSSVLGKRPAHSEGGASVEGGAECPLCGRTVHWPAQASDAAANAAMSRHLDSSECGATTGPPLPEPKAKKARRRGIEAFFGKSL
ncbi:DNA/RNA polymerase [Tilletiopsis washingtonensis]|uniref:DNA polymerase kappa n=1 Tax=Tilletiopsis washingtonensis TaxID=58919 RepID=A0A316ZF12_9BASI|nr:DNA/RNA polymerase [Tilletiopsis washingtonensis]PWN98935.1 DNA/RNA polymerase [Tilletiopsis washingtonensis]